MELVSAAFALATVCLVFHFVARLYADSTVRRLGYVAIIGHAATGFLILHVLPYAWDIVEFDRAARTLLAGDPLSKSVSVSSFASFQALLYVIFGAYPIVVSIVNGLLAVLVAILVHELAAALYPDFDGNTATIVVALFTPLTFLFLSIPMRDALTTFSMLLILTLVGIGLAANRYWLFLPIVPLYGGLYLLRTELALLAILGIGAAYTVSIFNWMAKRQASVPLVAGTGVGIGLAGFILFFRRFPVWQLNRALDVRAIGGAAYLEWMRYDGVVDVLLVAPTRAIYFQFAPFPLHVTSFFDLLAAVTIPFLIFLLVAGYWSLRRHDTDPAVLILLLTVYLGGIVGYGLIDSNFGTAVRHRMPFEFILIVLAAPALGSIERSLRGLFEEPETQAGSEDE